MSSKPKKAAPAKKKASGYRMPKEMKQGETITDTITKRSWKLGPIIGTGGFGAIYSACEIGSKDNYSFVVKIEPHENGPLFVERNFYLRNANPNDIAEFMKAKKLSSFGMPVYYGSGSHMYNGEKYRFIVMERYGKDIWSIFTEFEMKFPQHTVFILALQMIDVLEYMHSRGYVHADLKGANILLGYKKGTESQAYLVDFGLVTRITDDEFKPNPKCAHNGTIEYTSRDAHLGGALLSFFEYINSLKPKQKPDYKKCKQILEKGLKETGEKGTKLDFSNKQRSATSKVTTPRKSPAPKKKATRSKKVVISPSTDEAGSDIEEVDTNTAPDSDEELLSTKKRNIAKTKKVIKSVSVEEDSDIEEVDTIKRSAAKKTTPKRKKNHTPDSSEEKIPSKKRTIAIQTADEVGESRRSKKRSLSTPPVKKNHVNSGTQTSTGKRSSPRNETPLSNTELLNASIDIFEDSPEMLPKKTRKLVSVEDVTVTRKVVTKTSSTGKSWKDFSTVANGRPPPKNKPEK